MTSLSHLFSKSEGFVSEVINKHKGNCYGIFYFTTMELQNTKIIIITSVELQNIFRFRKQCAAGIGKPIVFKTINIEIVIFSSISKAK